MKRDDSREKRGNGDAAMLEREEEIVRVVDCENKLGDMG